MARIENPNENRIRIQNEEYYKVYDEIARKIPIDDQIDILRQNNQYIPENDEGVSIPLKHNVCLLFDTFD